MEEIFERCKYETKDEWLRIRGKGIGGSDSSSIVGLNPYRTNLELWESKTGLKTFDNISNEFTEFGHLVEPNIRGLFNALFRDSLEAKVYDEVLIRKDKPYLRASLDGEIKVINDIDFISYFKFHYNDKVTEMPEPIKIKVGMRGILECKSTFILSSMSKEKWNNHIPDNYFCQICHYLLVTNYDFVILPALLVWEDANGVKTLEMRFYALLRSDVEESLKYLEEKETDFWENYVIPKKEPALIMNM